MQVEILDKVQNQVPKAVQGEVSVGAESSEMGPQRERRHHTAEAVTQLVCNRLPDVSGHQDAMQENHGWTSSEVSIVHWADVERGCRDGVVGCGHELSVLTNAARSHRSNRRCNRRGSGLGGCLDRLELPALHL